MKEVYIPKLGQTVEEVTLVRWLVEDGALVTIGQEVLEVETDKAIFAVEAIGKGALYIDPAYKPGDVLPVLTVVGTIGVRSQEPGARSQEPGASTPQARFEAQNEEAKRQNVQLDGDDVKLKTQNYLPRRARAAWQRNTALTSPRSRRPAAAARASPRAMCAPRLRRSLSSPRSQKPRRPCNRCSPRSQRPRRLPSASPPRPALTCARSTAAVRAGASRATMCWATGNREQGTGNRV